MSNIMLYEIANQSCLLLSHLKDDPVRPHIPADKRVGKQSAVYFLKEETVQAIVCVSYQNKIPTDESELFSEENDPSAAIFYTVWSYEKGAGRKIIFDVVDHIRQNRPNVKRFVTLSPKTEMAKNFHLKNGAVVFRENETSVNYEYHVS